MANATASRRNVSQPSKSNGKADIGKAIDKALGNGSPAPAASPVVTLANAKGAAQAQAIKAALAMVGRKTAAAGLVEFGGVKAAEVFSSSPTLSTALAAIDRIRPIINSPAPAECFIDGNNRGTRVGDLWASALGLGVYYRDARKADIKAARAALNEGF